MSPNRPLLPAAGDALWYRARQGARLDSLEWFMVFVLAWLAVILAVSVLAFMATAAFLNRRG
jgi:hypothetical protein